jgi:hypothetical protein
MGFNRGKMNALLITLFAYAIPATFTGLAWYAQASTTSVLYMILIYHLSKSRERLALIVVEFFAFLCIVFSFASKYFFESENFVRANIADIMTAVFLIELLISGGIALGVHRRSAALRNNHSDSDQSINRRNLHGQVYS